MYFLWSCVYTFDENRSHFDFLIQVRNRVSKSIFTPSKTQPIFFKSETQKIHDLLKMNKWKSWVKRKTLTSTLINHFLGIKFTILLANFWAKL